MNHNHSFRRKTEVGYSSKTHQNDLISEILIKNSQNRQQQKNFLLKSPLIIKQTPRFLTTNVTLQLLNTGLPKFTTF